MVTIPENAVTAEELSQWYVMQQELAKLRASEMILRKRIFEHFFPVPEEGTNSVDLADGWVLKGKHTITRNVDQAALQVLSEKFREEGMNPDALIEQKPTLVKRAYNKLTDKQRHLFDQALIVKPGSPALEIVLPVKNRPTE